MSKLWIRKSFRSISPDDMRGVYQKSRASRGRRSTNGYQVPKLSKRVVSLLNGVLLGLSISLPILLLVRHALDLDVLVAPFAMISVVVHLFFIIGEVVMEQEFPNRSIAMTIVWVTILSAIVISGFR